MVRPQIAQATQKTTMTAPMMNVGVFAAVRNVRKRRLGATVTACVGAATLMRPPA